jgi:hypothetical protein
LTQVEKKENGFGPGLRAVKDHIRPFLFIQVCIVALVFAYYKVPAVTAFADNLAALKIRGGLPFAFIATAFAGVVLPEAFKIASGDGRRLWGTEFFYMILVFGINGLIVDALYRFLGYLFGNENTFSTVATKVIVDQTLAAPFIFMPYFGLMMLWRHFKFNFSALRANLKERPLFKQIWPSLIVGWAFWIPALCGIYAMPQKVQFVLFLFVEAAWSLIIIHVAKSMNEANLTE